MEFCALAFATVFLCNLMPAFAPPSWAVLVFFTLRYQLDAPGLIALGVAAAASGQIGRSHV